MPSTKNTEDFREENRTTFLNTSWRAQVNREMPCSSTEGTCTVILHTETETFNTIPNTSSTGFSTGQPGALTIFNEQK